MRGLVHIYTGEGKGKTTAAVGLGVRASGRGMKVVMVQFLKGMETGEMFSLKALEPGFILRRGTGTTKFTWQMTDEEKAATRLDQLKLFQYATEAALKEGCDLLILDEALGALSTGMLELSQLISLLVNKPEKLEVVITGRGAPQELVDLADYVTEMRPVKHPVNQGVYAREGIEY